MFKHYFETIKDIDLYPIVSLMIFFVFFVVLIAWVIKVDNKYIKKMESLPLDEDEGKLKNINNIKEAL